MKKFMLIPLVGLFLSGCGVSETFRALEDNRMAVERSTYVISENIQAIEEANLKIEENRRQLEAINHTLEEANKS